MWCGEFSHRNLSPWRQTKEAMLKPLNVEQAAVYQRTTLIQRRKGTGLPHGYGLKMIRLLGKGGNNAVYLYKTRDGQQVVLRQPRRKSDTQRLGNATWEFRNTAIAVQVGVAPILYDAWYNRHATHDQRGGLHFISEYFPHDLHNLLIETPEKVFGLASALCATVTEQLRTLAENSLFCYDLKPSNIVFREKPILVVKFIDFGRDFSEWRPFASDNEYLERAPVLSFMQTLAEENSSSTAAAKKLYTDLMYHVMLLILSSNIAFTLDSSRTASRQAFAEASSLNFMASVVKELRHDITGAHVMLLKKVLRQRDIRDTLRHYMGRRNCGTKRTFAYAGFKLNSSLVQQLSSADRPDRREKGPKETRTGDGAKCRAPSSPHPKARK